MKKSLLVVTLLFTSIVVLGQGPDQIIKQVLQAQSQIKTVSYTLNRTDTLLTDDIRTMSGEVKMQLNKQDSILGYNFQAKKDGEQLERVFDGRVAYEINHQDKTYNLSTLRSGILSNSYSGGGAHLLFPDLIKIDTSRADSFRLTQDSAYYYLTINYPDYEPENVVRRSKLFAIDKNLMLPVAMKNHQEAYGKTQDLCFKVMSLKINEPAFDYDFQNLPFLANYKHTIRPESGGRMPIMNLQNKPAPAFELASFRGELISSDGFKDKVVLIDLWEIWCGPCIATMPKVESLYEKYKDQGLLVFGITNDQKALSAAKAMAQKKAIKFPMLIGNEQFKKDYSLQNISLPMYIMIDRAGIVKLFPGFTDEIENYIKAALLQMD